MLSPGNVLTTSSAYTYKTTVQSYCNAWRTKELPSHRRPSFRLPSSHNPSCKAETHSGCIGVLTGIQNDLFAISHHHFPEDGFPNLEEMTATPVEHDEIASMSSLSKTPTQKISNLSNVPRISRADIQLLRSAAAEVRMTTEVATYLHNIALFMRLSRYVSGGVSALATRHFRTVCTSLAPLHNLTYCPPSLVALAARKIYPHRIVLATDKTERSLQWGSDPKAVRETLEDMTPEDAIEATLASVEAPL